MHEARAIHQHIEGAVRRRQLRDRGLVEDVEAQRHEACRSRELARASPR
jgi:hypothetical protein